MSRVLEPTPHRDEHGHSHQVHRNVSLDGHGHDNHGHHHDHDEDDHGHEHPLEMADLVRIGFVALAALASWLQLWHWFAPWDVIALGATLIGGYPIFREAFEAVTKRRMTMELSMTIALGAALGIGEFFTALVIVLFVLIAEVLEGLTVGRGRKAIKDLLDLLPQTTTVRQAGAEREVKIDDLQVGDVVTVKPGGRVPVDGAVTAGNSFVDEAAVTGESFPKEKVAGSQVFAGTINQSGILEVRVTGIGRDTAFGRIIQAVEEAERSRAPIQKTADRLAGYLVYFAMGCAALTFILTRDVRSTISVVIVAGACGVAAGTPLAILGAIGRAARQGAIVKGGLYMELLGQVDTVVLDKTGTLTLGAPTVVNVQLAGGATVEQLVASAAVAERSSEHPLAKAVLKKAAELALPVEFTDQFTYTPGKGIVCSIGGEEIVVGSRIFLKERGLDTEQVAIPPEDQSEVLVARQGSVLGALHIADVLRAEAVGAMARLRKMGLRTILLTGDSTAIARGIARQLGVTEVEAELLPDEKLARVRALMTDGRQVAMVGDGINDAPALMQAQVGVAMGSGADVARESANIVLLGNDLSRFVETVQVARRCRRIIMQNFAGTIMVDAVGIGLAAFGLLNPLLAVTIHVVSELAFILNSARLLPTRTGS